ncbi:MAG: DegT/DnrJ/EryC1/StrS family aminotransferase [Chthoniobacterales bacterium]
MAEASIIMTPRPHYRFPAIRPSMPAVASWAHYLEPAYRARWFSNFGPVVEQFEAALTARLCYDGEVVTSANNCTSGIAAALIALRVRGVVLIPAFTFPASASAVVMAGAKPCVMDVDRETWFLSPSLLEKAFRTEKCAAVVLVLPFGIRQDLSSHWEVCRHYDVPLVIDNASGLHTKETPLPNERCMEIYSLHATKPFAIGEGGAIRSFGSQAETLRRALNFGLERGIPANGCWGINGKLPEVSAAIGLAVLQDFDNVVAHRRSVARRYVDLLSEFENVSYASEVERGPWQGFPLLLPSLGVAKHFIEMTAAESLHIGRPYHPSLEDWPGTMKIGPCPNARSLAERMVSLPVYSDATEEEVTSIIEIVRRALRGSLSCSANERAG